MLTDTQSLFWSFRWLVILVVFAWPLGIASCLLFSILLPFYSEIHSLEFFIVWARQGMEFPYNTAVNMSLGVPMISLEAIRKSHASLPKPIILDLANPSSELTDSKDSEYLSSNSASNLSSNSMSNENEGNVRLGNRRVSPASLFLSCKSSHRPSFESGDHQRSRFRDRSVQTEAKSVTFSNQLTHNIDDISINSDQDTFRSLPSEMERCPRGFNNDHHRPFNSNHLPAYTTDHLVFSQSNNTKSRQKYRPGAIAGRDHRRFRPNEYVTFSHWSDSSSQSTSYSSAISRDDVDGRHEMNSATRKLEEQLTQLKRSKNHVMLKKKVYTVYKR